MGYLEKRGLMDVKTIYRTPSASVGCVCVGNQGWLVFGHDPDVDPVLRGEPRAISSIGRLFTRSRSPLRRRLLPSRLPTCPFNPLACLAPLLPTSVAMSALKRLLTGQHKLEKHHSLPSNTEARLDYVFQPRAHPSLPLHLTLQLPPTPASLSLDR